jgi:PTH1 family peptidyl-tRNA hydrolase
MGPDFRRLRIGVAHPGDKARVHGHVLGNFTAEERQWLDPLLDAIAEAAPSLAASDDANFMNRVALKTQPQRETKPKPETPGETKA